MNIESTKALEDSIDEDIAGICRDLAEELSDISQDRKVKFIKQILLDLTDYTSQTNDEKLWWELYDIVYKRTCKHLKTWNDHGIKYCESCKQAIEVTSYRD